jgi:hypothetical protein
MKQFSACLLAAALLAGAAGPATLSGDWEIHRSAAGNESDQTCTFTQNGDNLTGNCSSDGGPVKISGKVEAKKVTWTYKSDRDGSPLTVIYNGTLDSAGRMSGVVTAVEFGIDGQFTAARSK